jgi:hypothetical protein
MKSAMTTRMVSCLRSPLTIRAMCGTARSPSLGRSSSCSRLVLEYGGIEMRKIR